MAEIVYTTYRSTLKVPVEALTAASAGPSLFEKYIADVDKQIAKSVLGQSLAAIRAPSTEGGIYADIKRAYDACRKAERQLAKRVAADLSERLREQVLSGWAFKNLAPRAVKRAVAKAKRHAYHGARKQRKADARARRMLDRLTPMVWFDRPYMPVPEPPLSWSWPGAYLRCPSPLPLLVTSHV